MQALKWLLNAYVYFNSIQKFITNWEGLYMTWLRIVLIIGLPQTLLKIDGFGVMFTIGQA